MTKTGSPTATGRLVSRSVTVVEQYVPFGTGAEALAQLLGSEDGSLRCVLVLPSEETCFAVYVDARERTSAEPAAPADKNGVRLLPAVLIEPRPAGGS